MVGSYHYFRFTATVLTLTFIYCVARAKGWPLLTNNKNNHAKKFSYEGS